MYVCICICIHTHTHTHTKKTTFVDSDAQRTTVPLVSSKEKFPWALISQNATHLHSVLREWQTDSGTAYLPVII